MSPILDAREQCRGKAFVRRASCAAAPLGVLAFWSGMFLAARCYPSRYDWRYLSVSKLANPDNNPAGYPWAVAGIVLCGLCGLWWVTVLSQHIDQKDTGGTPHGVRALQLGYLSMVCAAVLPQWLLPIEKGHEILAASAFVGLLIGMVRLTFQTSERILLDRMRRSGGDARLYAFIAASVAVLPIVLAGLAQGYFYFVPPEFHGAGYSWRVRGWPVLLRFAFWEWVTCAVLSAYMAIISLAAHAALRRGDAGEGT